MLRGNRLTQALFLMGVIVATYITFFRGYDHPSALIWDETYHIASAAKYRAGIFFMEPHPPLGKMLIAFGETLVEPNRELDTRSYLKNHHIEDVVPGYSFAGVRLLPVLFACASAVVLYLIFLYLLSSPFLAFALTSLYFLDNALIVHSRAAMLEPFQIFFSLCSLLVIFRVIYRKITIGSRHYLLLGVLLGLTISVKATGALFLILFPLMFIWERFCATPSTEVVTKPSRLSLALPERFVMFLLPALVVFYGIWYLHCAAGQRVEGDNWYSASPYYRQVLQRGEAGSLSHFPRLLSEHLDYILDYNQGVPSLDPTHVDENGSFPLGWLVGHKSIGYRWEQDGDKVRHLSLQGNPVVWMLGLFAAVLASIFVGAYWLFGLEKRYDSRDVFALHVVWLLYIGYFTGILFISRVMYLYHYLLPLVFSFILCGLMFQMVLREEMETRRMTIVISITILLLSLSLSFWFFSPLSYYEPISAEDFVKRLWVSWWHLRVVP